MTMTADAIADMLVWICGVSGVLLVVAALLLYAIGNVTDSSGAKGQGAMITCAIGAIACIGAAAFITANKSAFSM